MSLSEKDVKEIKATYKRMMKCTLAFDWDGYAAAYTDDTIILPPGAERFQAQGQKSLADWTAEQMNGIESLEVSYDIQEVDGDGKCAYLYSPAKEKVKLSGSDEVLDFDGGKGLSIFEKQDDNSWKIKLQIWNK